MLQRTLGGSHLLRSRAQARAHGVWTVRHRIVVSHGGVDVVEAALDVVGAPLLRGVGRAVVPDVVQAGARRLAIARGSEVFAWLSRARRGAGLHHDRAKSIAIVAAFAVPAGAGPGAIGVRLAARIPGVGES